MAKNSLNKTKTKKGKKRKISPKTDYFLSQGISYIDYKDVVTLRKFINKQGRISHHQNTQLVAKTQRQLTKAIKRARQMALLPYTIVEQNEEIKK
jgi:small subunit ribosomal protein S18